MTSILEKLRGLVLNLAKSYGGLQGSVKSHWFQLAPRLASHPLLLVNTIGSLIGINHQGHAEEVVEQRRFGEVDYFDEVVAPDNGKARTIQLSPLSKKTVPQEAVRPPIQRAGPKGLGHQHGRGFPGPQRPELGQVVRPGGSRRIAIERWRGAGTILGFSSHVQQTRDSLAESFVMSPARFSSIGTHSSAISEEHQKADKFPLGSTKPLQDTRVRPGFLAAVSLLQGMPIERWREAGTIIGFASHVQKTRDSLAESLIVSPERFSDIRTHGSGISETHQKADKLPLGSSKPQQDTRVPLKFPAAVGLPQVPPRSFVGLQLRRFFEAKMDRARHFPAEGKPAQSTVSDTDMDRVLDFRAETSSRRNLGHPVGRTATVAQVSKGAQEKDPGVSVPFLARILASLLQRRLSPTERVLEPSASGRTFQLSSSRKAGSTTSLSIAKTRSVPTRFENSEALPAPNTRNGQGQDQAASVSFTHDSRLEHNNDIGGLSTVSVAFVAQKLLPGPLETLRRSAVATESWTLWTSPRKWVPLTQAFRGIWGATGGERKAVGHRAESNSIINKVEGIRSQPLAEADAPRLRSDSNESLIASGSSRNQSAKDLFSDTLGSQSALGRTVVSMVNWSLGMAHALSIRGIKGASAPKGPVQSVSSASAAPRSLAKLVSAYSDVEAARTHLHLSTRTRADWPPLANLPRDLQGPASNVDYSSGTTNLAAQRILPGFSDSTVFQPHVALPELAIEYPERPLPRLELSFEETSELRSQIAKILAEEARRYLGNE